MKQFLLITLLLGSTLFAKAQVASTDTIQSNVYQNTAGRMMSMDRKLTIGGYAQVDYNQVINSDTYNNGKLDVHRLVLLFGYKFNSRTQFITELEIEHVSEVYVEQAFLDYRINNYINFRAGLMLIPMGIVNEYHEPPTFFGVERPQLDYYIVPTTWREIGAGVTGNIPNASLKYQAYIVNGFSSYRDGPTLRGIDGLRKGRQKGVESFMSSPNFAAKVEYYGFSGLNIGLSGFFGNTESTLFNGIEKSNAAAVAQADSSVVAVTMIGLDARYYKRGFTFRGQINYATLSNTQAYNAIPTASGNMNNLGSALAGYYVEAGYNIFQGIKDIETELTPFVRYSELNTQYKVAGDMVKNESFARSIITTGLGWKVTPGAIFKADLQFVKTKAEESYNTTFNAGIGVWF